MAAQIYNMSIEQGATFRLGVVWKDSDEVPIDLTGYTARMQIRPFVLSQDVLLGLNTENGGITLGEDGQMTILATAEQTEVIGSKKGVYDLELESADGTVTRLIMGSVAISREVTR
jgi:hypothetical protein